MESISKSEMQGIGFLIRHFSEPHTIRQIALKLKVSPPGLLKGFKKLEKDAILIGQRFGTGLLYRVNLEDPMARHLAAISILSHPKKDMEKLKEASRLAIKRGTELLVVSDSHHEFKSSDYKVRILSSADFKSRVNARDRDVLRFIEEGDVLYGEDLLLEAIERTMFRF